MEIKDPVHGSLEFNKSEVAILDTPEFQRLRLIKQLGFSEFSFPGATHNRYLHSLGVCHLAGKVFDSIFRDYEFSRPEMKKRFRQVVRLAALLHDVGHGPLSHTTEEVMPRLSELRIEVYKHKKPNKQILFSEGFDRQANHEDYTIKMLTDSSLAETLKKNFSDISPYHVACLVDKSLESLDDFFKDQGVDFRTILSQLVSSEIDCDRMDYLQRDSYFCGTNYGMIEYEWLVDNLTYHIIDNEAFLALNRRALYTFDDFLISRHHMYLMIYFHHKSIIYEEMLYRFLTSPDCTYKLPADIPHYLSCTDSSLFEHMAHSKNPWAQKIARREPFKVLIEMHSTGENLRAERMKEQLEEKNIAVIMASSQARLSKYHAGHPEDRNLMIYVVDQYDTLQAPVSIDKCTEVFKKYEEARNIDRLYVDRENYDEARALVYGVSKEKGLMK